MFSDSSEKLSAPTKGAVMESYKELVCAIHEVQKAVDSILRAIDEGHRPDWAELFHRKGLADTRYELAVLSHGLLPSWPPQTHEGRKRWGLSEEQVKTILVKSNKYAS